MLDSGPGAPFVLYRSGMTDMAAVSADCRRDDLGASAVEYAILAGFIAAVIVVSVALIAPALIPGFVTVTAAL